MATNAIQSVRLLVVSREPAVLRPLWSIGESNCWHLETAGSGWEALERLQAGAAPDLLLLESAGSDGDGLHMLRWLRRMRPDLPIILISPTDDAESKQEAIRLGAQAILVRPLEEQQLEFVIRRNLGRGVLGRRRAISAAKMSNRLEMAHSLSPPARSCASCGSRPSCWRKPRSRC